MSSGKFSGKFGEWRRATWLRLKALMKRRQLERDLEEELRFHLEMREEKLRAEQNVEKSRATSSKAANDLSEYEARAAARRKFGNVTLLKEACREMWTFRWLETLLQDLRFGMRMLRKSPAFTAIAVLTLALGIGANTAIFSAVNAELLNGLPYPDASRLIIMNESLPKMADTMVSWPDFLDWRAQSRSFDEMAAYQATTSTLIGAGKPEVIPVQFVSPAYFALLGAKPYLGRLLDTADDKGAGATAVVVSYSFWRNKLKSDAAIVGKSIDLDGFPTRVVGVLPPNFHDFAGQPDAYGPIGWMSSVPTFADRADHPGILVLARLRADVSIRAAQTEMDTIMGRLGEQYPKSDRGERANVTPIFTFYLGSTEEVLLLLFAAVGFVLLLACANVANLSMARTSSHQRELGVRAALGASRSRLIRQLLVESLLLSLLGAGLGLLVAFEAEKLFFRAVFDPAVLTFTLAAALLTTVLFGLAPSWQTTQLDLSQSLREYGQNASGPSAQRRLRSALMAFEIAVALVVVVSSGLVIRSLAATLAVDPGFRPDHVLALDIQIPGEKLNQKDYALNFVSEALHRIRHLPGVRFAGAAMNPPLMGVHWTSPYVVEGQAAPPLTEWPNTALNMVTPDYFRTIGTPLLAGRYFTESDNAASVAVAIVNQAMARRISPNGSAVGMQLRVRYSARPLVQVVGVIPDLKQYGLNTGDWPEVFVPFAQMPVSFVTIMARTTGDPASLDHDAVLAIQKVDPEQPVSDVVPLSDYISNSVQQERFQAWLLGAFGVLALVLAAIGIYGVLAFSTSQRTHEIGVRMALGARPGDILRLVLGEGMISIGFGILAGIGGALALTRYLNALLFRVRPTDPATFAGVTALLILIALVACYVPARRAMRVDPMVALRHE